MSKMRRKILEHPGATDPAMNPDSMENQLRRIAKELAAADPLFPVAMERVDGQTNYIVENDTFRGFLHSAYDRPREMREMFRGVAPDTQVLLVFGFGMGDAVTWAAENLPELEKMIVIEPSSQLLVAALRYPGVIDKLKKVPVVNFVANKPLAEAIGYMAGEINQDFRKRYGFAYHMAHRSLFRGYYESFNEQVLSHFRRTGVAIRTVEANIYVKTQNVVNNLRSRSVDIQTLLDRLKGRPAIMVSAGPSLNKNMHLLEKAKEKIFVIAVGSAIKILHNNGIRPHARAAFSPHPDENTVFDGIADFGNIPLVYASTLDYLVVKKYNAPKARMVMESDAMTRYLYTLGGILHTLVGSGGTIANVTFDLLCRAGCSQVIFTGQDLSFTGLKLYADGSWSDPHYSGQEAGMIKTKDIYGAETFTMPAFLGLKQDFEAAIKGYPGIKIINSTEGGLPIEGAPAKPLQSVLDEIGETFDYDAMLREVFFEQEEQASESEQLDAVIAKTVEDMRQVIAINEKRGEGVKAALGDGKNQHRMLRELDKLSALEDELLQIPFYHDVLQWEVSTPFAVIQNAYQYTGDEVEKKVWSRLNILTAKTSKLQEYARFLEETMSQQAR